MYKKMLLQGIRESQNVRGCKASPEISKSNLPAKTGSPRAGHKGAVPGNSRIDLACKKDMQLSKPLEQPRKLLHLQKIHTEI